jgi:homopolymeric O-antigen transport system ATP-binding protein
MRRAGTAMAVDAPLISLRNVGVCYWRRGRIGYGRGRAFWALHDVSFDLYHGEALGVIGRNGAGKSTLLRLLAGILRPDRGTLTTFSPHVASLQTLQVGFANHLTGRENAILSGMLLGLTYRRVIELLERIIDYSGLGDFIDEPLAIYSSGMRARLGFSVAYFADPEIILLDETLGAGDAEFRVKSEASMRERIRSDRTVVLVSHSAATIREVCDRAVLIDAGIVITEGATAEVLARYDGLIRQSRPHP